MADTLTIPLAPEAAERLRRLAEASGETLEALAQGLLEDTAAEFDSAMGDDAELARRIALWREHRFGVPAEDVHAWLEARLTDPNAPKPAPTRFP
jgi:predicted transcriptional regulator